MFGDVVSKMKYLGISQDEALAPYNNFVGGEWSSPDDEVLVKLALQMIAEEAPQLENGMASSFSLPDIILFPCTN